MATLLLQAAGAALGGVFGPVGAIIGRAAGAIAGSMVDRALIGGGSTVSGARLSTARIPGADEGTAVSRLYGTARIGGTLIWATRFEEEVTVERSGSKAASGPRVENFRYYANFAVGLCEGQIATVRRVWADGREIDLTGVQMRVHIGTATQLPDPLIEAKQGAGMAPAYRGLAYVVFERLPLDSFGNRIPLLQFEVVRPIGRLEKQIRAVTLIPGATEHGYRTVAVTERTGEGSGRIMNRNSLQGATDWDVSIDELTAICPNLTSVALVVSWFGTDLRAGNCRIVPGVETLQREEESSPWSVSGVGRGEAHLISSNQGGPAYGGTPDDASVVSAIADLKARGLKVYLYPFLMMDIPHGNVLPDPHAGTTQAAYPWRGRITCFPAAGQSGTVDRTAAARTQLGAFAGSARAVDFDIDDQSVAYRGNDEGYRRLVLHYALLAKAAGGVDGFIIGSELRGLTQVRDESGRFPFVATLATLAGDVRAILGAGTKLTYGADWSEYFGYHPADGSGDVFYNLDPLWASPAIDAVGIDNYMPLADWRDGDVSEANPDGFAIADDVAAMTEAITAGEGYDWYYASPSDRAARKRSPITDGLAGKPWVFRYKDIESWWANPHHERTGGAEHAAPTAWVPRGKPIWFTELGCPAIDKGANQPNVFSDPKSSESAAPYFSHRTRADSMQRRFLEAHNDKWNSPAAPAGMVDPNHVFIWTWDARPFPAFPANASLWSDGTNWRTGHWLNGRLGSATLAEAIAAILRDHGFEDFDVSAVTGDLTGYVQADVVSARGLIEPLLDTFQVDVIEDGVLRFRSRGRASLPATPLPVLADLEDEPLWQETRGHDSDFAAEAIVTFYNPDNDYEQASARSRRVAAATSRVLRQDLAAVLPEEAALGAAEALLRDNRSARRSVRFATGPGELRIQAGDVISLPGGPEGRFLVSRIEDGAARKIEAREFVAEASGFQPMNDGGKQTGEGASNLFAPVVHLMDLPRFEAGEAASFARAALLARPWRVTGLSSSATGEGYRARALFERPARIGTLRAPLGAGVSGRFDRSQTIEFDLAYGSVSSAPALSVLNGVNRLAVRCDSGDWEIAAFLEAEEIAANRWRLGGLLRGLAGTEDAMTAGAKLGAPIVMLDEAVKPLGLTAEEMGLRLNWMAEATGRTPSRAGPFVFEGGVRAETPLSPVHLRVHRNMEGATVLTWIRRSRLDADNWTAAEIPLDEAAEGYLLEILDGETTLRQVEVGASTWIYPPAEEIEDFGLPQSELRVRLRQKGRKVPLGIAALATLSI
ncbi:glycoside hydrolase/phage tail family protein [Rhizobium sp. BK251]|uniref:baseplate multidomain protein megatron n=1 Tax=Rhizobium sp. BK251 TaxID=2512125 RepID=UPI00104FCC1F|nr:glycoside hydrolase/phage tail family protein [Rhizobium sp. BK251]TCL76181.1 putative tail protein [Rhizobium sp. BK251]